MCRKYLVLAGVLCIVAVNVGGCKSSEEETIKNIKIGVTLYDQYDTFLSEMMAEFTKYTADKEEESGVAINMEIMDASQSQLTQNEQVKSLIDKGCDVICVNLVDRTEPTTITDLAENNNVPIIFFNRELVAEDLERWTELYYVGADASESGTLEGELAADAFGAAHAFLMVGGTTSSVQTMVLTACKRGDEIILPRNVHRSVLNALVLCGAIPVYVNPEVDQRLGISLGMQREQVAKAIKEHPKAVAVLVNNPTYYGICSDLRAIVKMAHEAGMMCLVDEAHGTHFYFGGGLPVSAMEAGADMASVSMHKSGGSLTQSSLLLTGPDVHAGYVRQIINLTQTTSGSYLLMSSLDISRRNLAQRGRQIFHQVADMAEYAREEINAIGGYYAFGKELVNGNSVFDFDITKLSVHTLDIGLAGIEVYDILRDEYDIQIEFGDIGNILAYLSIGDRAQEVERLVSALAEIRRRFQTDGTGLLSQEYIDPQVVTSPQDAFYADKCSLPLRETEGMVCSEFVMCYPPGIPILAPGERITAEILDYIEYAKAKGCNMTGPEDPDILKLNVLTGR